MVVMIIAIPIATVIVTISDASSSEIDGSLNIWPIIALGNS